MAGVAEARYNGFNAPALCGAAKGIEGMLAHESPARPGAIANEIDAVRDSRDGCFRELKVQPLGQEIADPGAAFDSLSTTQANQQQIIHVARVALHLQLALDEMVQRVQVDKREQLAEQVADRQPDRLAVIGEPHHHIHQARILEPALDQGAQDRAVDAVVEPPDIELQRVAVAWHVAQCLLHVVGCRVRAVTRPTGERLGDKGGVEYGLDDAVDGVLHNPVAERWRRYQPWLRHLHHEGVVGLRRVAAVVQCAVQIIKMGADVTLELEARTSTALVAPGVEIALVQIVSAERQVE